MAVEVSTGVFATSQRTCIYMLLMLCEYVFAVLFTFPPFHLPFPSISGEFIVCFVQNFTYFALFSYYCSSGQVVSECRISFGNIHFFGELICLCTCTCIIIPHFRFSFILSTKFFVSPRILTVFLGFFTNHSPGYVTMTSHPKWRSTDRLVENIHFLSDYSMHRSFFYIPFSYFVEHYCFRAYCVILFIFNANFIV